MALLDNSNILNNPAFQITVPVKRNQTGALNTTTGVWVSGTAIPDLSIRCSIQPANLEEKQYLAEALEGGQEITNAIRIYNFSKDLVLQPGTTGDNATEADIVVYDGLDWVVVQLSDFKQHGHQKVFGVRTDGQNG